MGLILLIIIVILLIGGLPTWPHSAQFGWGWGPSGFLGVVLVVILILMVIGRM